MFMVTDPYATSHFSDKALLVDIKSNRGTERGATAVMLSRIAEVEERRLYLGEGYSSMYAFCVGELGYCGQAAYKRITVARKARQLPQIFDMVADGRLHLSGLVALSGYLTSGNADDLLAAAAHQTVPEIEQLIAHRFPKPDVPEQIRALHAPAPAVPIVPPSADELSSRRVEPPLDPSSPALQLSSRRAEAAPRTDPASPAPALQLSSRRVCDQARLVRREVAMR